MGFHYILNPLVEMILHRHDPSDFTGNSGWTGLYSGGTGVSHSSGYLVTVCTKRDQFPQNIGRELSRCSRNDTAQA